MTVTDGRHRLFLIVKMYHLSRADSPYLSGLGPAQQSWRYVPSLSIVSNHSHRFSIVASEYSRNESRAFRRECDPVTDAELDHLGVYAHLGKEFQARHDPVVEVDELRFAQLFDINLHLYLNSKRDSMGGLNIASGKASVHNHQIGSPLNSGWPLTPSCH